MTVLSREALDADVLQLARLLTESHPDAFGADGPIAFRGRVDEILASLPADGMPVDRFLALVRPLVASVQDGHTWIGLPDAPSHERPARVWLEWEMVEERLVLRTVYQPEHRRLLGARLVAVQGVPFAELVRRMHGLRGADNVYNDLDHLRWALKDEIGLGDLLNETLRVVALKLALPDGTAATLELRLAADAPGDAIEPPSSVTLPPVNAADIGWGFLDAQRSVAILRIDSLTRYREGFESARSAGQTDVLGAQLSEVSEKAAGHALETVEARFAAVPSATEACRGLLSGMREARTTSLFVDLRRNAGGNSYLALILEYFLYGLEGVLVSDQGYQIKRFSPLYLENRPAASDTQRRQIGTCLRNGGYDFTDEREWRQQQAGPGPEERAQRLRQFREHLSRSPTFAAAVDHGPLSPTEARVIVLTSGETFSAGFDVAAMLVKHGATVVGVPSSQAGNCFIDGLWYHLDHSKLRGTISYKRSFLFPREPERGKLLRPDVELTYGYLAGTGFDPNATARLALEWIAAQRITEPFERQADR